MNNVIPETITFKDFERIAFEFGCKITRIILTGFLMDTDKQLCDARDKAEYRHKGSRRTTIKTLMGECR